MTLNKTLTAVLFCAALEACQCSNSTPTTDAGPVDAGCDGLAGCACKLGVCTTGECISGTCVDCRRGAAACICLSNGTCNAGLGCDGGLCQTCPEGQQGCACAGGATCNAGLTCANTVCVPNTCNDGANGCPCRADGGTACDGTQYCDSTTRCQTCGPDVAGCPCASGQCQGGLTCNTGTMVCHAPYSCADLYDAGTCPAHEGCNEGIGSDAMCAAGTCTGDFKWDSSSMACVPCVSMGCTMEPDCSADAGFALGCATQHRTCVQTGTASSCGPCVSGWADSMGNCVQVPTCGNTTCGLNQYCDTSGATATCTALPCPAGQALTSGPSGTCETCGITCTAAGFSGRIWPLATLTDTCVCETLDGYFLPAGGSSQPVLCDADKDGWVRLEAADMLIAADPAYRANARCQVRSVDRFHLVDEYGLGIDVLSCNSGLVPVYPDAGVGPCPISVPIRLLESKVLDEPGRPQTAYGANGRLVEAHELNPLTKGCASIAADFNDNGLEDIAEVQNLAPASEADTLSAFAYFMELYTSWFDPTVDALHGRLVIAERSRCDGTFPLRYDETVTDPDAPTDLYSPAAGATYWRNCSRARDPSWVMGNTTPGLDFAQYTCSAGACPIVAPPHATLVAPTNPDVVLLRNFGLCELDGGQPADGVWRGMLHHSQFKCVNVTGTPASSYDHPPTDFGAGTGLLSFNACNARPCDAGTACTVPQGPPGLVEGSSPSFTCTVAATAPAGAVGFAAVNYRPYGLDAGFTQQFYKGGCVNEDTQYGSYLCPYPEYDLSRAGDTSFGRYSCFGLGENYLWCDQACVTPPISTLFWTDVAGPDGGSPDSGSVLR